MTQAPRPPGGACWATLVAGCAFAFAAAAQSQSPDADALPAVPGLVLSDVQPLPAEDRDSHGALLEDGAPVRAQQGQQRSAQPIVPSRIGRNASSVVERTRSWNDVQQVDGRDVVPTGEASGAGSDAPTPRTPE